MYAVNIVALLRVDKHQQCVIVAVLLVTSFSSAVKIRGFADDVSLVSEQTTDCQAPDNTMTCVGSCARTWISAHRD